MTLIQELRRRRSLSLNVTRGKPPPKPKHLYIWKMPWFLQVLMAVVVLWIAYFVVMFIGFVTQEALAITGAFAILWLFKPIRNTFTAFFRGEPFRGRELVESSPSYTQFTYGALPSAAACFLLPYPEIACAAVVGGLMLRPAALALDGRRLPSNPFAAPVVIEDEPDTSNPGPWGLWLGESTGALSSLHSKTGLAPNQNIMLDRESACRGVAVMGLSGSGKSRKVVLPLLLQLLDHGAGGLIYDIKGDDYDGTITQAEILTGHTIHRIGIGGLSMNLLDGLSPDTAGEFLSSCFRSEGQSVAESKTWTDLAVGRCREALKILTYSPGEYTLRGLYRFFFDDKFRAEAMTRADMVLENLDGSDLTDEETHSLRGALEYQTAVVDKTEHRQLASIKLSFENLLARFMDYNLSNAFCGANEANLDRILDGDVFIINVPEDQYAGSARVIYRLITQRFQTLAKTRTKMRHGPRKDNPIFMLMDEAQSVLARGDEKFHSVCRSLNVVSIIASQSLEHYEEALGGEATAGMLLAGFSSVISFRSTAKTMQWVSDQVGNIDFWKLSESGGKSSNPPLLGFISISSSTNEGRSVTEERRTLIEPALFRGLEPEQAVALLTINRQSADDIIRVPYISDEMLRRY